MRVMSFNVNGIRAAYAKGFIELLNDKQPDIVCLQEVKAHEDDIPAMPLDYVAKFHCAERKGYSGVGIVSRLEPNSHSCGLTVKKYDSEGRVLRADFGDLTVLSVYVPSGSSGSPRQIYKMQFLKVFKSHIKKLLAEGRDLIICGDINIAHKEIDLTNWQSNQKNSGFLPEERSWMDGFLKLGLVDAYRSYAGPETTTYSWWSLRTNARARNVGWRLDYQFVTPKLAEKIRLAEMPMSPNLSDHAPVIVDYDL
ncbi:MAG: exodeoxyribonuclease III [Trueperaceae bacterium]|nr:exodeoxyribonuclease III [Trueperaceae bacterium]